jgi:hypothetical protein
MGILSDFSKRKAQELRNDQPTAETDQPSSQSTEDPTNNLEYVDQSDQKKNHTNGPHGDSTNKTAQLERVPRDFPVKPLGRKDPAEDRVTCGCCGRSWDDSISTSWTPAPSARCPFEYFHTYDEDDECVELTPAEIEMEAKLVRMDAHDDLGPSIADEIVIASRNPFHVAQVKETGHVGGDMSDNETAETGNIGGNNPMKESYNGGGRTPGNIANPDSVGPAQHDRENNSQGKQIT